MTIHVYPAGCAPYAPWSDRDECLPLHKQIWQQRLPRPTAVSEGCRTAAIACRILRTHAVKPICSSWQAHTLQHDSNSWELQHDKLAACLCPIAATLYLSRCAQQSTHAHDAACSTCHQQLHLLHPQDAESTAHACGLHFAVLQA
jgi:hypothetical protein